MHMNIKKLIRLLPGGKKYLDQRRYKKQKKQTEAYGDNAKERFTTIYKDKIWSDGETVSGPGSTLQYTENIRKELPALFDELRIMSFLDAPCGDFNWFSKINLPEEFRYTGGDIVKDIITSNKELYQGDNVGFIELNIIEDPLPSADLWMCRDCLFHFSNEDIIHTLHNFLAADIQYLLTSTHTKITKNLDIPTGEARGLNLEMSPFNFPKADRYIEDYIEGFPVRYLALWSRDAVKGALERI